MAEKKERSEKRIDKAKPKRTPKVKALVKEGSFRIVGIGASAGGLEAFEQFFSSMPPDKGIAFVIVQHLDPTGHSSMPQILSRFTKMPVEVATDGMIVEPNSIYLLPPNKSMGIQDGALYLQEPTRPPGLRLPIDFFFRSLAKEMGADAICVILSGTGTDGTLGLRAIKAELGTVFVQDPESARYDGMPRSALDTGLADFVLKPGEMPEKLIQFVEHSVVNGAKFGATIAEELIHVNQQLEDLAKFPQENPNPTMRIDKNGVVLTANPACSKLDYFKCQPGQVLPKQYQKIAAKVLDTGLSQTVEVEGRERTFALNFVPIAKSGYVNIYGNDITDHKRAEQNLSETRDYLDNLINYANAPIIVWDPEYKITRFNHAFERLTGRTAEEMLGKKVDILIPKDRRKDALEKINRATVKGERWEIVEIPVQLVDGSVRVILWNSATLFKANGKIPISTIAQGQDITELKKIDKMKDEFIGLVSHELRTPLTVITGSLHTAMSEGLSPKDMHELLQNAAGSADSLEAILENMLELSRQQAGRLQLRTEEVNIPDVAQSVIGKLKGQGTSQRFLADFPDDLPTVKADPTRVERILYNLLENATKYSPEKSEIKVSGQAKGDFIIVNVTDRGKGISPDDQKKLFELFEQLEEGKHSTRGLGLGLLVCKRLLEAQGGWIKVDSEPGKGSTFTFGLPIRRTKT